MRVSAGLSPDFPRGRQGEPNKPLAGAQRNRCRRRLRLGPPVQPGSRTAVVDADVAGAPVPPGTVVLVPLGAAGRDPRGFPDPHRLLPDRQPERLVSGPGGHCPPGAARARLEAVAALGHCPPAPAEPGTGCRPAPLGRPAASGAPVRPGPGASRT
ncbi:cytochrome P450 [Streptomyces sp. NPDC001761]